MGSFYFKVLKMFAMAALLLTAGPIHAGYNDLIDTLTEGGTLTAEQAEKLKADSEKSMVTSSSAGFKDVQIRGQIQTQLAYVQAENDSQWGDFSTIELRRVRLGLKGTLLNDVRANLEANMVPGSDFSMRSAFLQWRRYKQANIKVGLDKPFLSLEENTSSSEILTVERSFINNAVVLAKPVNGLSVMGELGSWSYGLGVYTDRQNTNPSGEDPRYLHNARLALTLDSLLGSGRSLLIHTTYLNSDDLGGQMGSDFDEIKIIGFQYVQNKLGVSAEYFLAKERSHQEISGWYVMPSYYISSSNQAVFRYDYAHSDDDVGLTVSKRYTQSIPTLGASAQNKGNFYQASYFGWNHYLSGHAHKLMAAVEIATMKGTTSGDLQSVTYYGAWRMLF